MIRGPVEYCTFPHPEVCGRPLDEESREFARAAERRGITIFTGLCLAHQRTILHRWKEAKKELDMRAKEETRAKKDRTRWQSSAKCQLGEITLTRTSEILKLHPAAIRVMVECGSLEARIVGARYFIKVSSLKGLLERLISDKIITGTALGEIPPAVLRKLRTRAPVALPIVESIISSETAEQEPGAPD